MCVAAVAWHAHPRWRLVAIGNRDEFHQRPAAPLHVWTEGSGIVAGRDLTGGGTWLGAGADGRFALVTNRRGFEPPDPARLSRGELTAGLLRGEDPGDLDQYNPFNLLVAGGDTFEYLTNRPEPVRTLLGHGIYGLSNGALDEPWPKTLALKAALNDWLAAGEADPERLFAALASTDRPALGLPPRLPSDVPLEPADTPPFIRHALYGTRCSTVAALTPEGSGWIVERRFGNDGAFSGEARVPLG